MSRHSDLMQNFRDPHFYGAVLTEYVYTAGRFSVAFNYVTDVFEQVCQVVGNDYEIGCAVFHYFALKCGTVKSRENNKHRHVCVRISSYCFHYPNAVKL